MDEWWWQEFTAYCDKWDRLRREQHEKDMKRLHKRRYERGVLVLCFLGLAWLLGTLVGVVALLL